VEEKGFKEIRSHWDIVSNGKWCLAWSVKLDTLAEGKIIPKTHQPGWTSSLFWRPNNC